MKTKFYAVLHVTPRQYTKLVTLGSRVIATLTTNVAIYATPDPSVPDLTTEVEKLAGLNGLAKGNTQKKDERDAQAVLVHQMLSDERDYVNGIAKGDKVLVDQSGFDSDKTPETRGIPPVPVIKKVIDGKVARSAKVALARPLTKRARYSVQVAELVISGGGGGGGFDPDSLPWSTVLEGVNSNELLVLNLKRGVDVVIRVRAELGSNKSSWCDPYLFMAR